jgi:hypothetical protein
VKWQGFDLTQFSKAGTVKCTERFVALLQSKHIIISEQQSKRGE